MHVISAIKHYFFTSCSKDNQSQKLNSKVLSGVWELRAVAGGMIAYDPDNYKPGNGDKWLFTETGFAKFFRDSVYRSGTCSISYGTGTDENTGRKIDQFIFDNKPGESFELKDDTLSLYYGTFALDGAVTKYVKIADDTTEYGMPK